MIFENDPKTFEVFIWKTSKTKDAENIKTYHHEYNKLSDAGYHFGTSCLKSSSSGAYCLRPVFRNLWGVLPWADLGLPWDTIGLILTCRQNLRVNIIQISKIPKQHYDRSEKKNTNHTLKNSSQHSNKNTHNQSKQICFHFRCLTKPRKSEAPGL